MSIERGVLILAGIMVMLTTLLAMFHSPNWAWFTLFIGFNVFQSALTGFCPAAIIMKKMGMKSSSELAASTAEG